MSEEGEPEACPLCMEELDATDKNFHPCPCGYQICAWCWHQRTCTHPTPFDGVSSANLVTLVRNRFQQRIKCWVIGYPVRLCVLGARNYAAKQARGLLCGTVMELAAKDNKGGRCPACRTEYKEQDINFTAPDPDRFAHMRSAARRFTI
eukprot:1195006-Prorocentrum_minimum.AAC.4